jgi:hypothetical protein
MNSGIRWKTSLSSCRCSLLAQGKLPFFVFPFFALLLHVFILEYANVKFWRRT